MICCVNGKCVPTGSIHYREIGFGDPVSLEQFPYRVEYSKRELLEFLRDPYNEWLSEMRNDYQSTGDPCPRYLHELYFPPMEILLQHEKELANALQTYLYIDLFSRSLQVSPSLEAVQWIINSIDLIRFESDSIAIEGKAFRRAK